jgi:DNA-binding beta-propeller fold protein YncE
MLLLALFPAPALADGGAPNLAYIAGASKGISVLDIGQQRVTSSFALGGDPHTLFLSLDGRFLDVAQPVLNQVSLLAAKTGQVLCSAHLPGQPSLLAFDAVTNTLFAAGNQAATISALDPSTCRVLHTLPTDGPVSGLATLDRADVSGDNQLWVATARDVLIFDTRTDRLTGTITLPGSPRLLTLPLGASWAYVTTAQGHLYVIERATHQILLLLSGGQFGSMDFDQTTGEVYVPDRAHQQVEVLMPPDPGSPTPPHEPGFIYHLSAAPQAVAITSDGSLGFVALSSGRVVMLDLVGRSIVATFQVGGDPRFVITGLYPPVLGTMPQQTSLEEKLITIGGYLLVGLLLLVPIWLFWRRRKQRE